MKNKEKRATLNRSGLHKDQDEVRKESDVGWLRKILHGTPKTVFFSLFFFEKLDKIQYPHRSSSSSRAAAVVVHHRKERRCRDGAVLDRRLGCWGKLHPPRRPPDGESVRHFLLF